MALRSDSFRMIIERIVVPAQYNVVSSAKIDLLEFNLMKQKSLKKIINKSGPKENPEVPLFLISLS